MLSLKLEMEVGQTRFSEHEKTDFVEPDVMDDINTGLSGREESVNLSASSLRKVLHDARRIFLDTVFDRTSTHSTVCRMRKLVFKMIQSLQFSYDLTSFFLKLKLIKF